MKTTRLMALLLPAWLMLCSCTTRPPQRYGMVVGVNKEKLGQGAHSGGGMELLPPTTGHDPLVCPRCSETLLIVALSPSSE